MPGTLSIDQEREAADQSSSVQVAVRVRPMLPQEAGNTQCVEVLDSSPTIRNNVVRLGGESGPKFTFDHVFPLTTTQQNVYQLRVAPLVSSCLEGYNATILAYGQTGSGYVLFPLLGWYQRCFSWYPVVADTYCSRSTHSL